jgi:hypothetical protein
MRRGLLAVGFAGVFAIASASRAAAQVASAAPAEPADSSASFGELEARIGDPPRPDVVHALVRHAGVDDPATATRLIDELVERGGFAVALELSVLARHRDRAVRFAAIRGISAVALRRVDAAERVRGALLDPDADVRTAAHEALARVGVAADVPGLLDDLRSDDDRTQAAARQALTTLTGLAMPADEPGRWSDWWKQAQATLPAQLGDAIRRIELGGAAADVRDARRFLARSAWFDVGKVEETTRAWLHALDARHRIEGYRAAATCRLGDLADDVRRAARDETEAEPTLVAALCAKVLGVEVESGVHPVVLADPVALLESEDDVGPTLTNEEHEDFQRRLVQYRDEIERAQAQRRARGPRGGGGGLGGSGSDFDGDRAQARSDAPALGPDAASDPATPRFPWAWFGILPVVAALLFVLRRSLAKRGEERDDPVDVDPTGPLPNVEAERREDPDEKNLVAELSGLGLHAEGLAAAGVRAREVARVVHGTRLWLESNRMLLHDVAARHADATARRDQMKRMADGRATSPVETVALSEAIAKVDAISAERAAARDELYEAATAALMSESKATLARIRTNQRGRRLPVHYLVVDRTDEEWKRLGESLLAEQQAKRTRRGLAAPIAKHLGEVRSDLAVWDARCNLNQSLGDVTLAWEEAVSRRRPAATIAV